MLCSGKSSSKQYRTRQPEVPEEETTPEEEWANRCMDPESSHGDGSSFYINALIMHTKVKIAVDEFKKETRAKNREYFDEAVNSPNPLQFPVLRALSHDLTMELIEPHKYVFEGLAQAAASKQGSSSLDYNSYSAPREFAENETDGFTSMIRDFLGEKGMEAFVEKIYSYGSFVTVRVDVVNYNMAELLYEHNPVANAIGYTVQAVGDSVMGLFRGADDRKHFGNAIVEACSKKHTFDFYDTPFRGNLLTVQSVLQTAEKQEDYFRCCLNVLKPLGGEKAEHAGSSCAIS